MHTRDACHGALLLLSLADAPALMAQGQTAPTPATAAISAGNTMVPASAPVSSDEALRRQADESARDKAIAEAKLEVISAGNSRLEVLIGAFGTLVTVLLGGFAVLTYQQAGAAAAKAAKEEFAALNAQMDALLTAATETSGKIVQEHDKITKLSESARAAVNKPPGSKIGKAVAPVERKELTAAAVTAGATPVNLRTAQDFRILMYQAEQDEDWQAYVDLAEGMAYLHGDAPDDLTFALFGKAFGLQKLKNYDLAAKYYEDYLRRCPNDNAIFRSGALSNWANAVFDQAKTKKGPEADALFAQSSEKYAAALAIKPDRPDTLKNWGIALSYQANTKKDAEAHTLLEQAGEKYAAALAIKPDDADTLDNLGITLWEQAKTKNGAEADALFAQAAERYAAALAIKPDKHETLTNWGVALSDWGKTKQGGEADALFVQAGEKYAAALAIKPDDAGTLGNWAHTLMLEARSKPREVADALVARAEEQCLRAKALVPGSGAYNLACIRARRGDASGAADWLRKSRQADGSCPDCDHIAGDTDFDRVRETVEFRQALVDIGCLPATGDTA